MVSFGKIGKYVAGAGYGILFIVSLVMTIMLSKYCQGVIKGYNKHFSVKDPQSAKSKIYDTSISCAVFASITMVAALAGLLLSGIFSLLKFVLILLACLTSLFAIVTTILEGLIYHFYITAPVNAGYRNTSSRSYLKDSIQALYERAYSNLESFKTTYSSVFPITTMPLKWEQASQLIGTNVIDDIPLLKFAGYSEYYFTYSSFMVNEKIPPHPKVIRFYISRQINNFATSTSYSDAGTFIFAKYGNCDFPVASLNFKSDTFTQKVKRQVCWPTSDNTDYECKYVSTDVTDQRVYLDPDYQEGQYEYSPFSITQYIVPDNKYFSLLQSILADEKKLVNYQIENFPISFRLMNPDEIKECFTAFVSGDKKAFYFTDDSKHFKVSAKKYLKYKKNDLKTLDETGKKAFYWCAKEPSNYVESATACTQITAEIGLYDYIPKAFPFANVGKYPGFFNSYLVSQYRDNVMVFVPEDSDTRLIEFTFIIMLIQIIAIVFLLIGTIPTIISPVEDVVEA